MEYCLQPWVSWSYLQNNNSIFLTAGWLLFCKKKTSWNPGLQTIFNELYIYIYIYREFEMKSMEKKRKTVMKIILSDFSIGIASKEWITKKEKNMYMHFVHVEILVVQWLLPLVMNTVDRVQIKDKAVCTSPNAYILKKCRGSTITPPATGK